MATLHFIARTKEEVDKPFDVQALQTVLMDALYEYIEKRRDVERYVNSGPFYPGEDIKARMELVQRKVDVATSITNLFMVPEATQYSAEEEKTLGRLEALKVRRIPSGRLTETEALYVYRRHEARTNDGYVIPEAREWWRNVDAIAPSWLTSMDIDS